MISYYWTVGMTNPYWFVTDSIVGNQDTDTDLMPEDFEKWFPHAMPISQKDYDERSITLAKYMSYRRHRKRAKNR
jgi:hypothetical protein